MDKDQAKELAESTLLLSFQMKGINIAAIKPDLQQNGQYGIFIHFEDEASRRNFNAYAESSEGQEKYKGISIASDVSGANYQHSSPKLG